LCANTRLPDDFKVNSKVGASHKEVFVPLTKAELLLDRERRANRPLSEMVVNEATPMINGYKIIKETPTYYKVPSTPLRDELGLRLATISEQKKR
jgi:hypothetical protein